MKSNPLNPPYQGEAYNNSPLSRGARGVKYCALVTTLILLVFPSLIMADPIPTVRFDAENKLYRPDNWRQWVFIGAQITPNDMNGGSAYLPEFHYVYIDPESFAHWKKTGVFRNGATFVKELLSVGSKEGMTGNGYFPGEFVGLEVSHKDKKRFPDNPGGWAFFSYGKPPYGEKSADLKGDGELDCGGCHARGAEDWVFTEYYAILRDSRP